MIKTVWAEWEQICADSNDEEVDDNDKLTEDQVFSTTFTFYSLQNMPTRITIAMNINYLSRFTLY